MKKNVLIRCDASKEIGLGHITRCLVLAKQLRDKGLKIYFALKDYKIAKEKVEEENFEILFACKNSFNYEKWILDICNEKKINLFIGDIRDGFPISTIKTLKEKEILTVAIDEPSEYAKECDLCFYPPHANVDKTLYKGKVFKGFEYVILRPEFYKNFEKTRNDIPKVLIMLGGTDAKNLSFELVKVLLAFKEKIQIHLIINSNHKDYEKVLPLKNKIFIHPFIDNMTEFLSQIDYAIISFGTTIYEMISKEIPSVSICLREEHYKDCDYFYKNGLSNRIMWDRLYKIDSLDCFKVNKIENKIENKIVSEICKELLK